MRFLVALAAGKSTVLTADEAIRLTVITGVGATATVSRVDGPDATVHTTGAENQFTVAATTRLVLDIDWPFYLISVAGGPCRVGAV